MTRFQTISALLLAFVTMIGLSACGSASASEGGWNYHEYTVTLKDGRSMPCIGLSNALDCDWSQLK